MIITKELIDFDPYVRIPPTCTQFTRNRLIFELSILFPLFIRSILANKENSLEGRMIGNRNKFLYVSKKRRNDKKFV